MGGPSGDSRSADGRPNIVFVLTDDQDARSVAEMPNVRSLLVEGGTTFANAFATVPLCCPSRATFLRGQYAHNTRIRGNSLPLGGHGKFRRLGLEDSTVATWLDGAGYETAYLGKYMNGYDDTTHVPPGWDRWFGWLGFYKSPDGSYSINADGGITTHERGEVHDTDLLAREAKRFVRDEADEDRPFFLWVAPNAPHEPYYAAERHEGDFANEPLPRPPSFGEPDVSDKPAWVQKKPPLTSADVARLTGVHRDRLEALRSVDEMVGGLVSALRETGQLEDTYLVYASDNGHVLGEHRLELKGFPYEESIKIPLVVRGPGVPEGRETDHLVANNDFAPTIADLAGVEAPDFADGRSLVPLLREEEPEEWRTALLAEHWDRTWRAVRTRGHVYVEYEGKARELYDLRDDPHQLSNAYETADPALLEALESRLERLRDCSEDACRAAEDGP